MMQRFISNLPVPFRLTWVFCLLCLAFPALAAPQGDYPTLVITVERQQTSRDAGAPPLAPSVVKQILGGKLLEKGFTVLEAPGLPEGAEARLSARTEIWDNGAHPYNDEIHSYGATLSIRVATVGGHLLASGSATANALYHNPETGGQLALKKAAKKLVPEIAVQVAKEWSASKERHSVRRSAPVPVAAPGAGEDKATPQRALAKDAPEKDAAPPTNAEAPRVALVIGNWAYGSSSLKTPKYDAEAMAGKLEEAGFQVMHRENLNHEGFLQAMRALKKKVRDGIALLFYAGHGTWTEKGNYLFPVGDKLAEKKPIEVAMVLERMKSAKNRLNILILDVCHPEPAPGGPGARAGRGFAPMTAPGGMVIASVECASGASREVDPENGNSPYTAALVRHLGTPGLTLKQLFRRVGDSAREETGGGWMPWARGRLEGDFSFVPEGQ